MTPPDQAPTRGRSALRRGFDWWVGDPGRRVFVWLVWAAFVAVAAGQVLLYGRNLPANDEWAFVPTLFAPTSEQVNWLFERHVDHRFPLARAAFLALFRLSGHDFRAGMWANVAVVASAAGLLVVAARTLRGRTEYTDCLYPALMLHRGHGENFLMGYQLAYTLTVLGLCGFLLAVAKGRTTLAAVCAAVVALGGGVGVVFAPLLGGWVLWRVWRTGRGWLAAGVAVAALGYVGWIVADTLRHPPSEPRNPPARAVEVTLQCTQTAFGHPFGVIADHTLGWAVLSVAAIVGAGLLWAARTPPHRPVAFGLLAVLVGALGFVAVIGVSRPHGFAWRFASFAQFLPLVGLLAAARFLPRRMPLVWLAAVLTAAVAGYVVRENWGAAGMYANRYLTAYELAESDAAAGVPIDLWAERHVPYFSTGFPQFWPLLRDHRVGPAALAPPPRPLRPEPIPLRRVPALDPRFTPLVPDHQFFALDCGDRFAVAVRLRFTRPTLREWETVHFHWVTVNPDGSERVHSEALRPWVLPGESSVVLWVNARLRGVWVESGEPHWLVTPHAAEVLIDP